MLCFHFLYHSLAYEQLEAGMLSLCISISGASTVPGTMGRSVK